MPHHPYAVHFGLLERNLPGPSDFAAFPPDDREIDLPWYGGPDTRAYISGTWEVWGPEAAGGEDLHASRHLVVSIAQQPTADLLDEMFNLVAADPTIPGRLLEWGTVTTEDWSETVALFVHDPGMDRTESVSTHLGDEPGHGTYSGRDYTRVLRPIWCAYCGAREMDENTCPNAKDICNDCCGED